MQTISSIDRGVLGSARQVASPNFDERPAASAVELLVIHCISLPPGEYGGDAIERFFTNRLPAAEHPYFEEIAAMQVSAHLLIRRCGEVLQFVNFDKRAWHAGQSCFEGRDCCNDFSIGIELEGLDDQSFTDNQYQVLAEITRKLIEAYPGIEEDKIVGHQHIAPGRKTDPGAGFDWQRYRQAITAQS